MHLNAQKVKKKFNKPVYLISSSFLRPNRFARAESDWLIFPLRITMDIANKLDTYHATLY